MSKLIVFNTTHYGNILDLITFRLLRHPKDRCILLLTGMWQAPNEKFLKNLRRSRIFDKVICYDCSAHYSAETDEDLKKKLEKTFQIIQEEIGSAFSDCINYTSADIEDSFAMYLLMNNLTLTIIVPDYLRKIDDSSRYSELSRKGLATKPYCEMQLKLGVLDGCKNNCDLIVPVGYSESPDCEVYDYSSAVDKLSDSDLKTIEKCAKGYKLPKYGSTLVLTNSINYVKGVGIEKDELPYVYRDLVDYYIPPDEKVYLKLHPFSPDYSSCFSKRRIISPEFNIDFLRYIKDKKVKKIVSVQTSASDKLKKVCPNQIRVGISFFINYRIMSIIQDMMEKLAIHNNYVIYQDFIVDWIFS